MLTAKEYIELVRKPNSATTVADLVEQLSHAERVQLRDALQKIGCTKLVRNLYYDYTTQTWIK